MHKYQRHDNFSVLDSTGRIPVGLMKGNMIDLGVYDECVNINHKLENDTIKGRYCYSGVSVPISISSGLNMKTSYTSEYKVSVQ